MHSLRKNIHLGAIIKAQRKKLKITAETLAKKAGIDRTYISKIENYNLIPSWEILTAIERELQLTGLNELYIEQKHPEIIRDKGNITYKSSTELSTIADELSDFVSRITPKHQSTIKAFIINLLNKYTPGKSNNPKLIDDLVTRVKKIITGHQDYQKKYAEEESEIIKLINP